MKNLFTVALFGLLAFPTFAHNGKNSFEFIENKGQWPNQVLYHTRLLQGGIFVERDRLTFDLFSADQLNAMFAEKHDLSQPFTMDPSNPQVQQRNQASSALSFDKHAYSMVFEGASLNPVVSGSDMITKRVNYMIGNDESKWASDLKGYRELMFHDLWNGIDMNIYSTVTNLKYDYIVAPGADVNQIEIDYEGVNNVYVDSKGNLHIELSHGEIQELNPFAYQDINGQQHAVECNFKVRGTKVTFEFPNGYDATQELTIDPVLVFAGLSGSTADNWGFTATYDPAGNLYAAGIAFGVGYPTTVGAYGTAFLGGSFDISISKFDATGATELYATYLGGATETEMPTSIVCDSQSNLVLLGCTSSSDYPTTTGAYDETHNTGNPGTYANMWGYTLASGTDICLTKLDAAGAIIQSTLVGGTDNEGLNESLVYNYADQARGEVVLDASDNVYVCTSAWSTDFPVTNASTHSGAQDAVVFRMTADLSTMTWSTYYGGSSFDSGYSIRLNSNNQVFICGGTVSTDLDQDAGGLNTTLQGSWDGFIARFNATNGNLQADTYIGTADYDQTFILEIDSDDDVYVVGQTLGAYPVVNATYSNADSPQFIHKLNAALTTTDYSTIFGNGSLAFNPPSTRQVNISPTAFLVDNCGNVYVSGWGGGFNSAGGGPAYNPAAGGNTNGMPVSTDALQSTTDGSDFYFFVLEKNATGLLYGSYLGDNTTSEHTDGGTSRFDPNGIVYQSVCAACNTGLFPNTPGVAYPTSGTAGQAFLCNMGVIKFEMDFSDISAIGYAPPDTSLCSTPYDVEFSGSGDAVHHYWDFDTTNMGTSTSTNGYPTHTYADTGSYVVMYVAIDSATCNERDTSYFNVDVNAYAQFNATFNIPEPEPCTDPDSMLVTLDYSGTGVDSIAWNMGDGTTYGDSLATLTHYYTSQGTYYIVGVAYDLDCNFTDTIRDTARFIITNSTVSAYAPPDTSLCSTPYDVEFTAAASQYHFWDFDTTNMGTNTSTVQSPTHTYADTGSYVIMYVAIDSTTCNIADTAYFSVDVNAHAQFSATFNIPEPEPCTDPDSMLVSLAYTGTGVDSIAWDMGDGTTYGDSLASLTHYYTTQGTYPIVGIAYDLDCNFTDTIRDTARFIITNTTVAATAPPDVFSCDPPPYDVTFTAPGTPPTYQYYDLGDGNDTTSANFVHTYADSGTYNVMYVAIDSTTCNIADTAYFTITLAQAAQFDATFNIPEPDPCTDPDSMVVNLAFTGTGADSLVFDMGDGTVYTDSLASVTHYYTSQGTYPIQIIAYDLDCNYTDTIRDTARFIITNSTVAATAPPNVVLCSAPYDVDFSATSPVPDHYWSLGDGNDTTDAVFTHTYADTGTYNVMYIAIDSTTCNIADTAYFVVEVEQAAVFAATFNIPPIDPCIPLDSIPVTLSYTGSGVDSIYWDMGDGDTYGDSLASLTHYYTTQGIYPIVGIAYDLTCNATDTIRDTMVYIQNATTVTAPDPIDIELCTAPWSVQMDAPEYAPHYFWDFDDGNTSTDSSNVHVYADTGTYNVMYVQIDSSTCNIADTAYFSVSVNEAEELSLSFTIPALEPCDNPDSVLVEIDFTGTGADVLTYDMDSDGSIEYSNNFSVDHYYTQTGTFIITAFAADTVCMVDTTITDTVDYNPVWTTLNPVAPLDVELCTQPYDVLFEATGSYPDVIWNFGDGNGSTMDTITHTYAAIGTYNATLTVIDSTTCDTTATSSFVVTVNQAEQLSLDFTIPPYDPCVDTVQMLVELDFTGTGADSLYYDMGDGTTYANNFNVDHYYTNQGSYTITAYAADTVCDVDTTVTVDVDFIVTNSYAQATAPADVELCSQPYIVEFTSNSGVPYQIWDFGDGTTSDLDTVQHEFADTGLYIVTYIAIDSNSCNFADTATFNVQINQAEQFSAELSFDPPPPCESDSMLVELAFTGTGADSLEWDMGNGDILNDSAITYYYTEGGLYTVTLTAWDLQCDHVGSYSEDVVYFGDINTETLLPNIFSPDGDGKNDVLTFVNLNGTAQFKISIWNRWGRLLFESTDPTAPWDGTNAFGVNCDAGVYYYEVTYVNQCDDEIHIVPGFVHLVRGM